YTIAWICALHLELAASRAMLDEEHQPLPMYASDDNTYVLGRIDHHNVVMACLPGEYGTNNAAIVSTNLKRSFPNIRATLMVGIGGGSPRMANMYLGDIVVGTRVMQYDMGKVVASGRFEETTDSRLPSQLLLSAVSNLRSNHGPHGPSFRVNNLLLDRMSNYSRPTQHDLLFQATYEHPTGAPTCSECDKEKLLQRSVRSFEEPRIHYGVIASGNMVMKNATIRDDIATRLSALCFEMEAAGMMDNLHCLPIRGICDYSDSHKNKEWQPYAAATAAAYARELLEVLPPTCHWFLEHQAYKNWLNPAMQSDNSGFLWMRGKAGAGKSTMMKFVYLQAKRSNEPLTTIASFFFNAQGEYLDKSISGMYRSLLGQLLYAFRDLQRVLDDTDIIPLGQTSCPHLNALKELLRNAILELGERSFTCFIDALDECDEQEVRDMVQFFEELVENTVEKGIQFRVCFSSRPYPYIEIRQGILVTLEDESGHRQDLSRYVKNRLKIQSPTILEEVKTQILRKASGIFMWVVLVVEILNKESCDGALAIQKKLVQIPSKLSDLFKSILTRDRDNPERLLFCVLLILCAERPLTPMEFRHALWAGLLEQDLVDPNLPDADMDSSVKLVTSSSKGLAEITKSAHPSVQFIHESVRDFLLKERGLQELWPNLGFEWEYPSHDWLRRCCMEYLNQTTVQVTAGPTTQRRFDPRMPIDACPFLGYAISHILKHADAAAAAVPQDSFLAQFFSSDWFNIFNQFGDHYGPNASPLYILADKGYGKLIRTRLRRESSKYVPGQDYDCPFFAALAKGHEGAIAALANLPSPVYDCVNSGNDQDFYPDSWKPWRFRDRTLLSWAAQEDRPGIVRALIQGGTSMEEEDRGQYRPLMRALEQGHSAVAKILIYEGADVNARHSRYGWSALIWASRRGDEPIARLLLDEGADVNAKDMHGWTALIWASSGGNRTIAQLLIAKGADVRVTSNFGWTALQYAMQQGHRELVLLLERG
ncbi:uncharacterized protein NECHADRAFT_10992, partial [Fusarium vanettenii 77-13-4]